MFSNLRRKSTVAVLIASLALTSLAIAKVERKYSKVDDVTRVSVTVPFISKNDGFLGVRDYESNIGYGVGFWVDGDVSKGTISKDDMPDELAFVVSRDIEQTRGYREDVHLPKWADATTIVIVYRPFGQPKDEKLKRLDIAGEHQYSLQKLGEGSFSRETLIGYIPVATVCELAKSTDVTIGVQGDKYKFGEYDVKPKYMKDMQEICSLLSQSSK